MIWIPYRILLLTSILVSGVNRSAAGCGKRPPAPDVSAQHYPFLIVPSLSPVPAHSVFISGALSYRPPPPPHRRLRHTATLQPPHRQTREVGRRKVYFPRREAPFLGDGGGSPAGGGGGLPGGPKIENKNRTISKKSKKTEILRRKSILTPKSKTKSNVFGKIVF